MLLSSRYHFKMNDKLEKICNANNLWRAYDVGVIDTSWKQSIQWYNVNRLQNIAAVQKKIREGTYRQRPNCEFEIRERGHVRHIKSLHISDRVVQRSLNDNLLIPAVLPLLIYDNGASQKDKGTDFALRRFHIMLHKAYKEYGPGAVVLQTDFSKYFDNIIHEKAIELFRPLLNEQELEFISKCYNEFAVDVSYMTDKEYSQCIGKVFNSLEHAKIPKELLTGEKIMHKSVGIGNQISQVTGVFYPYRLDNYCKIVRGVKYYVRFMDDTISIYPDIETARSVYKGMLEICEGLGIFINEKKTCFKRITETITFLKINFRICGNGKVIRKIHNSTIRRERRRLRTYKRLADAGQLPVADIRNWFKSWLGTYKKYDSGYKLFRIQQYFNELFGGVENGPKTTTCSEDYRPEDYPF